LSPLVYRTGRILTKHKEQFILNTINLKEALTLDLYSSYFFILSFFVVTFALLHLLAGGAALLKGDKTTGNILVFAGGLIALPTIPLLSIVPGILFLTWILGATLCCVGAYKNGKEKGNINKSHHAIRITIAVLLTLGLSLV